MQNGLVMTQVEPLGGQEAYKAATLKTFYEKANVGV